MLSIIAILQTKIMRRRFQIGMGVNPSLIINKGIYIQHVDGGLYTKENWSNKGYSNDLCNGIALVDKVCFVIATEYIGTFSTILFNFYDLNRISDIVFPLVSNEFYKPIIIKY